MLRSLALCSVAAVVFCSPAPGQPSNHDIPKSGKALIDAYGDPLPMGAVARLGTLRWRHPDFVLALAFAPDGKTLISVGMDTIRQWQVSDGKLLGKIGTYRHFHAAPKADFPSHTRCAAISADGKVVVVAGECYEPKEHTKLVVWDIAGGKKLRVIVQETKDWLADIVAAIAFSPDGKKLATRSFRSTRVKLWEVATGEFLGEMGKPYVNPFDFWEGTTQNKRQSLCFSPDGQRLAAISEMGEFVVWDLATKKTLVRREDDKADAELVATKQGGLAMAKEKGIYATAQFNIPDKLVCFVSSWAGTPLAISPNAGRLAVAGYGTGPLADDGKNQLRVWMWDLATGKELWRSPEQPDWVTAVAFSPDGNLLAASVGSVLRLWDTQNGKVLTPDNGHEGTVGEVAVSPNGKSVLTGCGATLRAWSLPSGNYLWPTEGQFWTSPLYAPDGKSFAGLAESLTNFERDGKPATELCIWDAANGRILKRFSTPPFRPAGTASLLGSLGSGGGVASLLAIPPLLHGKLNEDSVWRLVAWSPDGRTLITSQHDGAVCHREVGTGKETLRLSGNPKGVGSVTCFSADGRRAAIHFQPKYKEFQQEAKKSVVSVRDYTLNRTLCRLTLHFVNGGPCAFSPDGRSFVLSPFLGVDVDKLLLKKQVSGFCLIEVHTGKVRRFVEVSENMDSFAFAPDNRTVAAACAGIVYFWDVPSGKLLGQTPVQEGEVAQLIFSADGKWLVSAVGTTALVWDVAALISAKKPKAPQALSPAQLAKHWQDLASADAEKAFTAIWALVDAPAQSVSYLKSRVQPEPPVTAQQFDQWIADLGSPKFAVRQKAMLALEKLGDAAENALRQSLPKQVELEVKLRLDQLLSKIENYSLPSDQVQQLRAVEVLRHIGDKQARQLLERLAKGAPTARLTSEAKAALKRVTTPAPE